MQQVTTARNTFLKNVLPCLSRRGVNTPFDIARQRVNADHTKPHKPMKTPTTKAPPRYVRKDRKGCYINMPLGDHARMTRRAAAANLSAGKYGEVGMKFYMDLEDAFGGPMTEQFRGMILRNVGAMAAKLEKMLQ